MSTLDQSQAPDFITIRFDEPLRQVGPWLLVDSGDDTQSFPLWREAFESLFEFVAAEIQSNWPVPQGTVAHAVLSGDRTSQAWNNSAEALGFHAILAREWEGDEEFLDVPDAHFCHVNVSAHQRACQADLNDAASVLAGLTTLPHEMAHVALFARQTQGKTPLEVFDEGGGEHVLAKILKSLENQAVEETGSPSAYGGNEDMVEHYASLLVDRWHAQVPGAKAMVNQLVDSLAPKPARKRAPTR